MAACRIVYLVRVLDYGCASCNKKRNVQNLTLCLTPNELRISSDIDGEPFEAGKFSVM